MERISISDFPLASYLHALGCSVVDYDRTDPKRVLFIFSLSPEEMQYIDNFKRGDCMINAIKFYASQKTLRRGLRGQENYL